MATVVDKVALIIGCIKLEMAQFQRANKSKKAFSTSSRIRKSANPINEPLARRSLKGKKR